MTKFHKRQKVWLYWPRPPVRQQYKKLTRLWTLENSLIQEFSSSKASPCLEWRNSSGTCRSFATLCFATSHWQRNRGWARHERPARRSRSDSNTQWDPSRRPWFVWAAGISGHGFTRTRFPVFGHAGPRFSSLQAVHPGSEAPGLSGAIHPWLKPCDLKHKNNLLNLKFCY